MTAAINRGTAGIVPLDRIGATPPAIPGDFIQRFLQINDLSSTIADILDKLGVVGTVGASTLRPAIGDAKIVGRAMTVRNVAHRSDVYVAAQNDDVRMNEMEAIHQADPGDVLVIQGAADISNMGGIVATLASRQKMTGAVIDGGIRDIGRLRALNFPAWSTHVTPATGKYRCVTDEINGTVNIAGVMVRAGDLVVADETGVCFVPQELVEKVLLKCEQAQKTEEQWLGDFASGTPVIDLMRKIYKVS